MTPKEITALFATAATSFQPIVGQPSDDDLTALRDVLYPLLLDIPFDEDGSHNLIGIVEPTTSYTNMWGAAFRDANMSANLTFVVNMSVNILPSVGPDIECSCFWASG
jgi:hypothetical protein